jgi:hypothetical protein
LAFRKFASACRRVASAETVFLDGPDRKHFFVGQHERGSSISKRERYVTPSCSGAGTCQSWPLSDVQVGRGMLRLCPLSRAISKLSKQYGRSFVRNPLRFGGVGVSSALSNSLLKRVPDCPPSLNLERYHTVRDSVGAPSNARRSFAPTSPMSYHACLGQSTFAQTSASFGTGTTDFGPDSDVSIGIDGARLVRCPA